MNSKTITLDMDRSQIPLRKFKKAVDAFFDLIESVSKEAGDGDALKWTISVEKGSARVIAFCEEESAQVAEVLKALPSGLKDLEKGNIVDLPHLFSEKAVKAARSLAVVKGRGENTIPIKVRVGRSFTSITSKTATTADDLIEGKHQSFGSIEGKLLMISDENGFSFAVSEAFFKQRVTCWVAEEFIDVAVKSFRKRVRVTGLVQYNRFQKPVSVRVSEIYQFPDNSELPSLEEMRGILA